MDTDRYARELLPGTLRSLDHRLATAQAEGRAPSVSAAVARGGRPLWTGGVGEEAGARVRYRVGSITKVFTAVLVRRLWDEGLISPEDPIGRHVPEAGPVAGAATIASLLSHTAGLGAETPGPWWERSEAGHHPDLAAVLGPDPARTGARGRFHYSNTGYTLLGALVTAVRGRPWIESLTAEVLEPLGLRDTSYGPVEPYARGWAVHPWADVVQPERVEDLGLMAPAGQLWSSVTDLVRFGHFLAHGQEGVLALESVRAMALSAAPADAWGPDGSYGLGLQLLRVGGRQWIGHTGSLPGYVAGLWIDPAQDLVGVALANCTSGLPAATLAAELMGRVIEAEPAFPAPWRPAEVPPAALELAGVWYWGTAAHTLRALAGGALELAPVGGAGRAARFRPAADGTWTGESGYHAYETLRAVRAADGTVGHLDVASFVFTRAPYDPAAPVPGGVDPRGWGAGRA
ncbi:serine hydrolase domain-containing protein [Streptomyces sp. BI20]|uniref:serine hydrolase domain-containing protein n=1 Tax=Streptomyces sp. BI20 TaxID=3403460 RepID=UPI003C794D9F